MKNEKQQPVVIQQAQISPKKETPTNVPTAVKTTTPPVKKGRLSKDLLLELENEIAQKENEKTEVIPISDSLIEQEKSNLINYLRSLEKTTLIDQLSLTTIIAQDEQTINIQCLTQVGIEIIGTGKDLLQDYFISKTNNKSLIVSVTLDPKNVTKEVTVERPLNKSETYEQMIKENKTLTELKQRLNLFID